MNADSRGVVFFARLTLVGIAGSIGAAMVYTVDGSTTDSPIVSPLPGNENTPIPVGYITGGRDGDIVGVYQNGIVAVQGVDSDGVAATIDRGTRLTLTAAWQNGASESACAIACDASANATANGTAAFEAIACTEIPALDPSGPVGYAIVNFSGASLSVAGAIASDAWDLIYAEPLQAPQGFGGIGVLTDITGINPTDGIPEGVMTLTGTTIRGQLYAQQEPGAAGDGPVLWRRLNGYRLAFMKAGVTGPLLTPANGVDGDLVTTTDTSLAVAIGDNPLGTDDVRYVFAFADVGRQQWIDQLRTAEADNATLRVGNPAADTATVKLDATAAAPLVEIGARVTGGTGAALTVARAAGVATFSLDDDDSAKSLEVTIDSATDAVEADLGDGVVASVSKIGGSTDGCSVAVGAGCGVGSSISNDLVTPTGGRFQLTFAGAAPNHLLPFAVVTIPTRGGRAPIAVLCRATSNNTNFNYNWNTFLVGTFGTKCTATALYLYGAGSEGSGDTVSVQYIAIYES
jgi:hypothetical protein